MAASKLFACGGRQLDLTKPHVMGVLNVTPDSFSDGGHFVSVEKAVAHALKMEDEGAAFIDIGGESTRPGAQPVPVEQEMARTIPVIQALKGRVSCLISIDTSTPQVMAAAASEGVHLINDVRALQKAGALAVAGNTGLPVCIMHMQGQPGTMQTNPSYSNVVQDVKAFLAERIQDCQGAGISTDKLLLDPGFGFGKTLQQNLLLLHHLDALLELECPLLVGMSRKSMIGQILEKPVEQRLFGSLSAAVMAFERGASIVRVHDVAATVDALQVASAVIGADTW